MRTLGVPSRDARDSIGDLTAVRGVKIDNGALMKRFWSAPLKLRTKFLNQSWKTAANTSFIFTTPDSSMPIGSPPRSSPYFQFDVLKVPVK